MNFGWLTEASSDEELHRVVLHEFGHVIGLRHEHQHIDAGIPWNKQAVYAYYKTHMGWSRSKIDDQVLAVANRTTTHFGKYDPKSIMHYAIPNELAIGNFEVGWNTDLSEIDKTGIGELYPITLAWDTNGGRGGPYFSRHRTTNHNQHWQLVPYQDFYTLVPRVRDSVALDANGGRGGPYFGKRENVHNHNLHWLLKPYKNYFLIVPRVRDDLALDANGGKDGVYFRKYGGGHNRNLHWALQRVGEYNMIIPRVRDYRA